MILWFWRKHDFSVLRKYNLLVLMGKCDFSVLTGKHSFLVLVGKHDFPVSRKI